MNRFVKILGATAGSAALIATGIGASASSAQTMPNFPTCAAGQQPTPQAPCIPAGMTPPAGGVPNMPNMPNMPGGAGGQGGLVGTNPVFANMPDCAPGTTPSPQNICKFSPNMPDCGPEGPPKLNPDGTLPEGAVPCKPHGAVQFDQAPPKEALNKLLTLDVDVDGSGEAPGTFDVTLNRIVKGIPAAKRAQLQDQLEGDSFIINTNGSTKCFADKKSDPDAVADLVSCKVLSDATDNYANTVQATTQVRMKFDNASFTPTFTATKIVIRGKSKI